MMRRTDFCRRLAVCFMLAVFVPLAAPDAAAQDKGNPHPCEDSPSYRQLDFWLGEWEVFNPQGQKVGDNSIQRALRGCAIVENWKDALGNEGKSFFYYDYAAGRWKQVWVTDAGGFKEKAQVVEFKEGGVRFQGEIPLRRGGTALDRTTLTALAQGRVRQVIEQSRDGGKTWAVTFDGMYVRKK